MFGHALIFAGLVPLAVAAVIAVLMRVRGVATPIVWPAALAGGFIAGQVGLRSSGGFASAVRSFVMPSEAVDWLPLVVLLALGVGALLRYAPVPAGPRLLALAIVFSLSVPIRLLAGGLAQRWSGLEKIAYLALVAATLGLLWIVLALERDDELPLVRPLLVGVVSVGTAVVLALSGVLVYGQAGGAVAAALAGTMVGLGLPGIGRHGLDTRERLRGFSGAASVLTFSLGSLIFLGHFYSGLTAGNAMLLFLALAVAGGPLPAAIARLPAWQRVGIRTVLCIVPLAIAIARAAQ